MLSFLHRNVCGYLPTCVTYIKHGSGDFHIISMSFLFALEVLDSGIDLNFISLTDFCLSVCNFVILIEKGKKINECHALAQKFGFKRGTSLWDKVETWEMSWGSQIASRVVVSIYTTICIALGCLTSSWKRHFCRQLKHLFTQSTYVFGYKSDPPPLTSSLSLN